MKFLFLTLTLLTLLALLALLIGRVLVNKGERRFLLDWYFLVCTFCVIVHRGKTRLDPPTDGAVDDENEYDQDNKT